MDLSILLSDLRFEYGDAQNLGGGEAKTQFWNRQQKSNTWIKISLRHFTSLNPLQSHVKIKGIMAVWQQICDSAYYSLHILRLKCALCFTFVGFGLIFVAVNSYRFNWQNMNNSK